MTDLMIKQGDTWTLQVGWFNPIGGSTRPDLARPVDITGYTARLWLVDSGGVPVLELSSPAAGLTVNGTAGMVDVRATPSQTSVLVAGFYRWEIEIANGTDTYTIDSGRATVTPQVVV